MASTTRVTHLLDTHAWIWFFNEEPEAQKLSLELLGDARLGISIITIWEAAMLEAKGRVHFVPDLDTQVQATETQDLCTVLPLSSKAAIGSMRLDNFHGDPADRLIVATARYIGATLVTADRKILDWAAVVPGRLKVLAI